MPKTGILLVNLGTPDQPDTASVRRYLKDFLSDPRVVDLPAPIRWLLLRLIILPFRPARSSKAYQQIWTKAGSPLLVNSQTFADALATRLGDAYHVALGMRYGSPNMVDALTQLKDCEQIKVLPLFPQYASATTGSVLEQVLRQLAPLPNIPGLTLINAFYNDPGFISAYAQMIKKTLGETKPDMLLFSYHGLPERQLKKSGGQFCYREQCYETSRLLAEALGLSETQYLVVFQSRLRGAWTKPYLDETLIRLARKGVKNIAIACPSFVADCLETLEEIDLRATNKWRRLGGERLIRVPCLNADEAWVEAVRAFLANI